MKFTFVRMGLMAVLVASLAACGGGGGGTSTPVSGGTSAGNSNVEIAAANNSGANDPTKTPQAPWNTFATLKIVPATVTGQPVVNFAVLDSKGKHVPGLKLIGGDAACGGNNVRMAIAKFDGSNWQSLISRQRYATNSAGQYAVVEATTDPIPTATITNPATALADPSKRVVGILQENAAAGYYTYNFATDVSTALNMSDAVDQNNVAPGKLANNGNLAAKDGVTIHRIGIQLCFVDPQTQETVKVNPYLDFTLDSNGVAQPVMDSQGNFTASRMVVDKASCNECHQALAVHGGGRVDPNFCVMCHNQGSKDYATNNPIDFKLMIHKFHMGKKLTQDYQVQDFVARKMDATTNVVTGVDYPQDQRNCVKCHDGSATATHKTKDGNNWMAKPSKNACFACHDDYKVAGSKWQMFHVGGPYIYPGVFNLADPDSIPDNLCANCHGSFPNVDTAAKHAISGWTYGLKYQYNIHSVTWNADRTVSVEFSVSNPVDGTVYNIKDAQYRYTTGAGANNSVFGNLSMLFGWGNGDYTNAGAAKGQPVSIGVASAVPVGVNHFTLTSSPLPASASGTGVVALQGSISLTNADNSPLLVPVKDAVSYFAIGGSGAVVPRRTVVSADKCNACHGKFINNHGHAGNQTETETCVICHNGNLLRNGKPDSAHFKRMIHAMHKAQGTNYPVMPSIQKPTVPPTTGSYIGYTGVMNCTVCHVNDSYKKDQGVMGSSTVLNDDPSTNPVISPKAAACSACHDSSTEMDHMMSAGGAVFGTKTQADLAGGRVVEGCDNCHAPGGLAPVDTKHGLK